MADDGAIPRDLLEDGDLAFVDAIREVHDAEALGEFASTWFTDRRDDSRWLLFEYLDRPLNAFRHEALIKRLFKMAEAEGDDPLMARFLVLFDRSIRRVRKSRTPSEGQSSVGLDRLVATPRQTTMPRGRMVEFRMWWTRKSMVLHDWAIRWYRLAVGSETPETDIRKLPAVLEQMKTLRLFSVATRNYLRRRAWRYFRRLGKDQPGRYVDAVAKALALYTDDDVADGLALIDNWGLMHILFHHSPAIEARPSGWTNRPGHSLGELAPAPIYPSLWKKSPGVVVGLLTRARSTTVRRWAIRWIEADPALHRLALPVDGWLELLQHDDPAVVSLAAEMLDKFEGLESLGVDRWLALVQATDPVALEPLCDLISRAVDATQVTLEQAVSLARLRPLPVAKLGFSWLKTKTIGPDDLQSVLPLVDARAELLRPEILRWLREVLTSSTGFEPSMVLDFLDSRHADVRREGWAWFRSEPRLLDDVETWRKLLESPYDDIRLPLVAELESTAGGVDLEPEALRALWAGVLLNVHRGSRARPGVVRQLLHRLETRPSEAPDLLPLLGIALRSVRGPERRAGLVAVVQLVERRAELESLVRSSFPELQMTGTVAMLPRSE